MFLVRDNGRLVQKTSPQFDKLLSMSDNSEVPQNTTTPSSFDVGLGAGVMFIVLFAGAITGLVWNSCRQSELKSIPAIDSSDSETKPQDDSED